MKFFEKKVKYFKFFEDSKIVEVDAINKRIAIIFFGKENIIHIFDASPYIDYIPIEELKEKSCNSNSEEDAEDHKEENQDLNEIFAQMAKSHVKPDEELGKTIITQNQEYIKFNNYSVNNIEKENAKNNKNSSYIESTLNQKSNINICLSSEYNKKHIKFSLHKPKIKNKLLSVIVCSSNIIIGIKWLDNIQPPTFNGQEKIQANQLLSVFDDGYVIVYSLKSSNYENETKVNLGKLQYNPFETYPEQWKVSGQIHTGKPIRDFYISKKCNRLYTLHADNFIIMWMISYISDKLSLLAIFAINITPDLPVNKFLVDMNDSYIFTFHNEYFKIFKVMEKIPFPMVFSRKIDHLEMVDLQKESDTAKIDKDTSTLKNGNDGVTEKSSNNKSTYKTPSNSITPIKNVSDDFIDDESYEIFYKDIIDRSEGMKIFDYNFFYNVQKPEFSLLEEHVLIPVFLIKHKKYVLYKFFVGEFLKKISDFSYFERSFRGIVDHDIFKILKLSHSPIVFTMSPYFYFRQEKFDCDILDKFMNSLEILERIYQPILLINEGTLNFLNLKHDSEIFNYELFNPKIINPEYLVVNWTSNNTIMMSSTKALMNVIKFCNEDRVLGIPVNVKKVAELRDSSEE